MYISTRARQVRNLALAGVNGSITLVILLIAPLGLAAVLINTGLVTLATFVTAIASDRLIRYLQKDSTRAELWGDSGRSMIRKRRGSEELEH
jgi:hypothetical protein